MKIPFVTSRKNAPAQVLDLKIENKRRVMASFFAGSMIVITYSDAKGAAKTRKAYVESVYEHLQYVVIKHPEFGYRSVYFERILGVN